MTPSTQETGADIRQIPTLITQLFPEILIADVPKTLTPSSPAPDIAVAGIAPRLNISSFSCPHIIPAQNLLTLALAKGPCGGELVFKAGVLERPGGIEVHSAYTLVSLSLLIVRHR